MYRKNVASQFFCFQGVDASTGGIKSGVTWTIRRCIDGTFAAGGGTVTEDSTNGWYKYAMSQADTNGNDISFNFTGTGAIPQTVNILTTACDPTSTAFGLSIAKTTNITGFNDIAATAIVSSGAITTSGGAVSLVTTTTTATNLTNLPSIPNNWLTAAGIAASALNGKGDWSTVNPTNLTAAQIATGVWTDTTAGDFTTSASIGKSVMNGVSLGTGLTVNDLTTKTGFALISAYDAAKTAADATTVAGEFSSLQSHGDSTWATATGFSTLTATDVENAVWDAAIASHLNAGSTGLALNSAGSAGDPWSTAIPGAYGAGTAGNIVGNNLDAAVSSRLAAANITLSGGIVSADVKKVNAIIVNGSGTAGSPWGP